MPNNYARVNWLMALMNWYSDKKVKHLRHYDIEELKVKFSKRNLKFKEVQYIGHFPYILNFLINKIFGFELKILNRIEEMFLIMIRQ